MEIRSHHFGQLLGQSIGKEAGKTRKMLETSVASRVVERVADLLALISRSSDHEAHGLPDWSMNNPIPYLGKLIYITERDVPVGKIPRYIDHRASQTTVRDNAPILNHCYQRREQRKNCQIYSSRRQREMDKR
ncbi:unnamed protein product [Heterotrigona itama]|uniref:Uncharacterized protein n=1 Tax=Heterotrigona itama TaxID=395501 RepID=A0A6V7HN56_9HYME|nr:unnamed protein product [Heterotrigona itama]